MSNEYRKKFTSAVFKSNFICHPELNPQFELDLKIPLFGSHIIDVINKDFLDGVVQDSRQMAGRCFALTRETSYALFETGIDHTVTIG